MIILKNRAAYVEVREGSATIFHKNKPPNHGGLTGRLLAAFGIVETGIYRITFTTGSPASLIVMMNGLDARIPDQAARADQYVCEIQVWSKEVTKLLL
jgi:hypothetical protein